jgi:hypothetical protein
MRWLMLLLIIAGLAWFVGRLLLRRRQSFTTLIRRS